jgi:hypothetical protein
LLSVVLGILLGMIAAGMAVASPVTYKAQVFMRGMRVTVPGAGWTVYEDHPGEFNLADESGAANGTHIHFWLDPYAVTPHDIRVRGVGRTPTALIAWLSSDHYLVVTAPTKVVLARGLATTSVDLDVAAAAPRSDPSCPGPCLDYFNFSGPNYEFGFGTGRGNPVRLYFATLRGANGTSHTFTIAIETPSARAFAAVLPVARKILASVRLPAKLTAG